MLPKSIILGFIALWGLTAPAATVDFTDRGANCDAILLGYDPRVGNLGLPDFSTRKPFDYSFLVPNELHPREASPLLRQVPKGGIILAVGTERVLYDYLLAGAQASLVIGIDLDRSVNIFHSLNATLLKITPNGDIATYRELRLQPNGHLWLSAGREALAKGRISQSEFATLIDPIAVKWWKENVTGWWSWRRLNHAPTFESSPFAGVNYLFDQNLFDKVQALALRNGYRSVNVDLGNPQQLNQLVAEIKNSGFKVHLLDISNAWQHEPPNWYLGALRTGALLFTVSQAMRDDSMLVVTRLDRRKHTTYRGYTMVQLKRWLFGADERAWHGLAERLDWNRYDSLDFSD